MSRRTEKRPQTIVYIDGFNFYYGAVKGTPHKWLDFEALCQGMLPRDRLIKIRYFTSRVSARSDDPQKPVRQDTYLRALATLPLVEIHFGHFVTRTERWPRADRRQGESRTVKIRRTEEKGSDVNLATYLLLDAFQGRCDTAAVISNDSDLAQAIDVAQSQLGIKVGVVNPHPRERRSRELLGLDCLFYKQVPRQLLAQTQLPLVVHGSKGPIRKPNSW
ncbi:MAG: NYN domain-containing protein [Acidimicrobiaceae bacterium]|nr:NYN domain-containing protein [Acidimicrobiaceae bacterium]